MNSRDVRRRVLPIGIHDENMGKAPAAVAARSPSSTAAPLPPFRGSRMTRKPGVAPSASAQPSVLPSTTTQTGCQWSAASATVSASRGPVL